MVAFMVFMMLIFLAFIMTGKQCNGCREAEHETDQYQ
jgi:hypothetical protein